MKKSPSSFDPQLIYDDHQPNQTSFAAMARRTSSSQSRFSQQQTGMDQRAVRQDLLSPSDGIFRLSHV